jgi:formate dehydrogenase subunit beta
MDNLLKMKKGSEQGLLDFLRFLLENKKVSAVFTLRKTHKEGTFDYGLITDVQMLKDAIPLHPFMPANGGQELSRFTNLKKPVAAVIRPCELRAFIELVKRSQGTLDNYILISYTCGGVFRFETTVKGDADEQLPGYWKAVVQGENFDGIRPMCLACEYFVPMNPDVTVSMIGENLDNECVLFLHTEKVKSMAEGFGAELSEGELGSKICDALREKRQAEKTRLFERIGSSSGLDGMIEIFGRCIGCHGCSRVCPICHCILCDFESHLFDYEATVIEKELLRKGGVRLPPDTVLYQLGRLSHMSFSCVGCGMCTEVCPASIPVSAVFMRTGEQTAKIFDYVPGRDLNEPVPVTVYKEEELSTIGE